MPVDKKDYAKLVAIVAKAEENAPDWLDKKVAATIATLAKNLPKLDPETLDQKAYDDLMGKAVKALQAVVAANKAGAPKGKDKEAAGKEEWTVKGFKDEGHCDEAAKHAMSGSFDSTYKAKKKELLNYDINEKHLGCLYEKNLTTTGDKYSFFFKYVRTDKVKPEAELVGVAIGCHSGSGNKYVVVDKKGGATKTPISAQKKNL